MTSRDFAFWLQGFFELRAGHDVPANSGGLTEAQTECIRRHLALVFIHEIDPSHGDAAQQAKLNAAHKHATGAGVLPKSETFSGAGPGGPVFRC